MKHIYNTIMVARTLQPDAKALGTATSSKIISLMLVCLFLLVSGESMGQTVLYGPNNFNNELGVTIRSVTGTTNTRVVNNESVLAVAGVNGNPRGYDGYISINQPFQLKVGYTYTASFRARAVGSVGEVFIQRGSSIPNAGSVNGISMGSAQIAINTSSFANYSIVFTVSEPYNAQYLALRVLNDQNNAALYIDDLSITEICTTPSAPTVQSTPGCSQITLTASGANSWESYRWYTQPNGGSAIPGVNGATYITSTPATYYVAKVNNATGCAIEGARTAVTATLNPIISGLTEFAEQNLVIGRPAIISLNSEVIARGHAAEVTWKMVVDGIESGLGTTIQPTVSPVSISVAEIPDGNVYFHAIITPITTVCYDRTSLDVTSQGIITLPVELISFSAQRQTKGVNLTWATASELDNSGFEVEVSTDSRNFQKIGFVESKVGTTSIRQNYSFLDSKAVSGTRYYRLKQVDLDGKFEYSVIKAISLDGSNGIAEAYPNPFSDVVVVKLTGTEARQVKAIMTDAMGKVVLETSENTAGNSISLNTAQITTKGIYILHVLDNGAKHSFKLIKR